MVGITKNWMVVQVHNRYELEALAVDQMNTTCQETLSHKMTFIGIDTVRHSGISFILTTQRENHIIITLQEVHYAGYDYWDQMFHRP